MFFIGDVHGKYERYKKLIQDKPASIQVGDMGVGFRRTQGPRAGEFFSNPPHYAMVPAHCFIRGNHDNPAECAKHSQWIQDGRVNGDVMFVGGALSVDRQFRIKDYSWWEDEELSIERLVNMASVYAVTKPRVMVTHDCPEEIARKILAHLNAYKINDPSRTRQAFQSMWEIHKPELWIFGHWHVSVDEIVDGTRFVCLAELEGKEIPVPALDQLVCQKSA